MNSDYYQAGLRRLLVHMSTNAKTVDKNVDLVYNRIRTLSSFELIPCSVIRCKYIVLVDSKEVDITNKENAESSQSMFEDGSKKAIYILVKEKGPIKSWHRKW